MDKRLATANAALDIMRLWRWMRGDPDGNVWPIHIDLHEMANRLAMEGIPSPQDVMLYLLCRGDLSATGDYRWRKYQNEKYFQHEETDAPIRQKQWQDLANLIDADRAERESGGFGLLHCNLSKLGMGHCSPFEWEFLDNRFSTAMCPISARDFDQKYSEEWFSASNIAIGRAWLDNDWLDLEPEPVPTLVTLETNKGGRPPAADWELAALEIAGRYYRGDFKPQTIADVGRELASWLGDQDSHLSDSVVRIHAKRIFEAFQTWERE